MRARTRKPVSGWRARRRLEAGGMLVRDAAAFRLHRWCDERSPLLGRVPAHVTARLVPALELARYRGDPDRLHCPAAPVPQKLKPLGPPALEGEPAGKSLLDAFILAHPDASPRLKAVTTRFRADYELTCLPGRLAIHPPDLLPAVRSRLAGFDGSLGAQLAEQAEAVLLDRLTGQAFQHVFGLGPEAAWAAVAELAALYGLPVLDGQEAGSAFASA
ncbi:MAG: hypothetical protein R3C13_01085 [Hyphomonas sp.]|uniref:hypothetical protein n=1 Tax=Hyphomonas sp. TaxID=87 RepID=UPI003529B67A